jgi:crotonobetainyl-CoA:carnitine CoA-transferase CaiB-like acyl-CoA transferase
VLVQHALDLGPGDVLAARLPMRLSRASTETAPAEPLGASTDAVLRDLLGLDDGTVEGLRAKGVLG